MQALRPNQASILASLVLAMLAAFALAGVLTMNVSRSVSADPQAASVPPAPAAPAEVDDPIFGNVPPGA